MIVNLNIINGLIILLYVILFSLFYNFSRVIFGSIYIILSLIVSIINLINNNHNSFMIHLYFLIIFIFYWVGNTYENNYSIESLIDEYGLNDKDILHFKFLVDQKKENEKCSITGDYENGTLTHNIKDTDSCNRIIENTNLNFIYK